MSKPGQQLNGATEKWIRNYVDDFELYMRADLPTGCRRRLLK